MKRRILYTSEPKSRTEKMNAQEAKVVAVIILVGSVIVILLIAWGMWGIP
jgi:flagellar biosynthesis/type III secretory pathway M-ring protein FliF/YscJ